MFGLWGRLPISPRYCLSSVLPPDTSARLRAQHDQIADLSQLQADRVPAIGTYRNITKVGTPMIPPGIRDGLA